MVFDIYTLVEAIWIILPAYAANGLTPIIGRFVKTHPIDGGRMYRGNPLFGKGKSWEGLLFGSFVGIVIALVEMWAYPFLPWELSPVGLTIVSMGPVLGFLLGFGALIGDVVGSFIKRRLNLKRGRPAPVLDQNDFVLGSLGFAALAVMVKWQWVVLLVIITPVFHFIANIIAYFLKVKKEPW